MRHLLTLLMVSFLSTSVFAEGRICARRFNFQGIDLCRSGSPRHRYVRSEKPEGEKICTTVYPDERCKFAKQEFAHALTQEGAVVCVLNFNQPSVTGNYCAKQSDQYGYVLDPWL